MTLNTRAILLCATLTIVTAVIGSNASMIELGLGRKNAPAMPLNIERNPVADALALIARTENVDFSYLDGVYDARDFSALPQSWSRHHAAT